MILGLDLSLTSSGAVFLDKDYKVTNTAVLSVPHTGVERLFHLENLFLDFINNIDVDLVCLESPAFQAQGHIFSIGELNGIIKLNLFKKGITIIEVAPSQLKKYVTGKGKGNKSVIIKEIYKQWNEDFSDDNIADGYVLSRIGSDYYIKYILREEIKLPKHQEDVLYKIYKKYNEIKLI